jgi:hypothetical protein
VSVGSAISDAFLVFQIVLLVIVILAANAAVPYLTWVLGFRLFGDDPGRHEASWRKRFFKRSIRGLLLMSHFARSFLPEQENPFRKFDRKANVYAAAVVTAFAALFVLALIVNRLR